MSLPLDTARPFELCDRLERAWPVRGHALDFRARGVYAFTSPRAREPLPLAEIDEFFAIHERIAAGPISPAAEKFAREEGARLASDSINATEAARRWLSANPGTNLQPNQLVAQARAYVRNAARGQR